VASSFYPAPTGVRVAHAEGYAAVFMPSRSTTFGNSSDRYLLHYYFEIFADGDTHYSRLYTEEVVTGAGGLPARDPAVPDQPEKHDSDFNGGGLIAESPSSSLSPKKRKSRGKKSKR